MAAEQNKKSAKRLKTESSEGKDFTQKTTLDDLTLLIEGKKLYVSKCVLSLASPVFKRMFESSFKESQSEELELPGKSYNAFCKFLRVIYPCRPDLTEGLVFDIFPLCEEYQVASIRKQCVNFFFTLLQRNPSMDTSFKILQLACLYDIHNAIVEHYLTKLSDDQHSFDEIVELEKKYEIPAEMKVRIRDKFIHRYI